MAIPAITQSEHEAVPFELHHEYLIVVKGSVGKLKNLSFVVDTGATHTMVDRKIAGKLSLQRESGKVLNFDRYVKVEWANIAELQLGPLKARSVRVMIGDLKQFSEFADGVDAVIGMDLLQMSQRMVIDYASRLVTFKFAGESDPARPQKPQIFTVRLSVQGQPMLLVVDTGLQGMLLYTDRLRKHLPQLRLTDRVAQVRLGHLTGERATLSGVRLGTDELQASVFLIHDAPDSLSADIDGYLGTRALNAKMVELDFATNTLRWQ